MQDIRYQRYSSSATLSTGNRLVRMVRKKHIPRSLNVAGYAIKTWYAGQPTECDIYREAHVAKNCPFRGKCRKCMQEGHVARDCTNPPNVWGTTAANAAAHVSCMDASAAEEVSPSSSAPIGSWGSQVDLHNGERASASEGLRENSIVSTPQLFSTSGDTAGCETIVPSGSDDVVDHESCGQTCSKVNDGNDKSNNISAIGVLDHGARDAMQPSCNSFDSNDTACSDVVSKIGVEKDPAVISYISKNADNNVNDNNDNDVSVIVVDSGFVRPSSVSNIIHSTEVVAGNLRPDVSDGHVESDEAVVASNSPSAPPPSSSSEVEMVEASTVRKRSRPPGLSDGESSGSAPSLKKGTKKGVRKSGGAGVLSQTVSRRETRSTPATVESRSTRPR